MKILFAAVLGLWVLALTSSQTPVPARPLGYTLSSPPSGHSPKVIVEMFYDHLCSDSKANWDTMKEVMDQTTNEDVTFIIHIFPLPYHHNAYFTQQVGVVVRQNKPEAFKNFIELIFEHQDSFLGGAVNMTEPQVQAALAKLTSDELGVDMQKIHSGFSDTVVVENARYAWKYAASRGITGTPQFVVNGVAVPSMPVGETPAIAWEKFILKLLDSPY